MKNLNTLLGIAQVQGAENRPTHHLVVTNFDLLRANADAIRDLKGGSKLVWVLDDIETVETVTGYAKDDAELPEHIRRQAEYLMDPESDRVKVRVVFATGLTAEDSAFGLIKSAGSTWNLMKLREDLEVAPRPAEEVVA